MADALLNAPLLGSDDFTFLTRREYFRELIERVAKTKKGDRVMIITHDFHPDEPLVAGLMEMLNVAAARGVHTNFAIDERSFPVMQRVPLNKKAQRLIRSTHETLGNLHAAGVNYTVTNKTFHRLINRFSGRAHIKMAIINDEVYVGGCNLLHTNQIDIMVRWHDSKAADWLYQLMGGVIKKGDTWSALSGKDRKLDLDEHTKLLLDAGKPRQSLIYENALKLIDEAKEWLVITCQYFPNSTTGKHLAAAYKRGVRVSIYYNHPSNHQPGFNTLIHAVVLRERTRHPSALFAEQLHKKVPYVHAKLLANESSAMVGSHNYVVAGVNLGTAELTLLRHDPEFARRAVEQFRAQLAPYIG
jgi:cardiolipin synthase